jgi:hypothetical protein
LATSKPPLSSSLIYLLFFIYSVLGRSRVGDALGSLQYPVLKIYPTWRGNTPNQYLRNSMLPQHHRLIIGEWGRLAAWQSKPSKANSTPCWLSLSLSFSPKSFFTSRVKHLDDGVPDSISSLMVSSRDHTSKTFPCACMHIHLVRGSLLKTELFPNT